MPPHNPHAAHETPGGVFHKDVTDARRVLLLRDGEHASFVEKLDLPNARIPLYKHEEPLIVDEPYVLVCPTYGGGATMTHQNSRPVPSQVIRFLNNEHNRGLIRAVVAGGNSNFGRDFGMAGEVIARKCSVPYVYRFELMGNPEDVRILRDGLITNATALGLEPLAASC